MKRVLQILSVGLMVFMPLMARPAYAASATLYLSPASGSVGKGSILTVNVRENSGGEPVNGAQANLTYPANLLDFVSVGNSAAFSVAAQSSGGGGSVKIGRGAFQAVSGNQTVASVRFRAKTNSGSATISFAGGSQVVSANTNQNIMSGSTGGTYTLTNPPPPAVKDTTPPTITGVTVSDVTINTATVSWTTSEPANSEVDYGFDNKYGLSNSDGNLVTAHKVTLTSALLIPGTTYHYLVKSADQSGNAATSADGQLETKGANLLVTVLNQKNNKPVAGVKVELGNKSGVTNKQGQVSLANLPLGKQSGKVTVKGKATPVSTEISKIDPAGKPQLLTFKVQVPSNLIWFILIPLILILLIGAWFLGLEEGEGKLPSLKVLMNRIMRRSPNVAPTVGSTSDPSLTRAKPPTVITPSEKPKEPPTTPPTI